MLKFPIMKMVNIFLLPVIFGIIFACLVGLIILLFNIKNREIFIFLPSFLGVLMSTFVFYLLFKSWNRKILITIRNAIKGENLSDSHFQPLIQEIASLIHLRHQLQAFYRSNTDWAETNKVTFLEFDTLVYNSIENNIQHFNLQFSHVLEELTQIISLNNSLINSSREIAQSSLEMNRDAQKTSQTANEGIRSVGNEIRAMSELKLTVGSSADIINDLNEMSAHVTKFVTTIGTISHRTQLLALNASIEAARAGETGRGFAVVASEIRTLSEASKAAAEEIERIINEINIRTRTVVDIMKNTTKIEENIKVVYTAGDTFMSIVKEVKAIDAVVKRISQITITSTHDSQMIGELLEKFRSQLKENFTLLKLLDDKITLQSQQIKNILENYKEIKQQYLNNLQTIQSLLKLSN